MALTQMSLPAVTGGNGLDQYIRSIRKFPMLEQEEEYMLAKRYVEHEDMSAAHRLVTSHLRLVVKIAHSFKGYGLPLAEMISEGNIGLMQAVKKFDPERGFRLSTYAIWWIKAAIQEYILRSWSLVKVGASLSQKKLFFNLNRLKNSIRAADHGDLTPEQVAHIAEELDVNEDEVVAMNHRMTASDRPLNAPMSHEDGGGQWMDMLADENDTHDVLYEERDEYTKRKSLLNKAMGTLKDREKAIFMERRLADPAKTLEELSQEYGVSRERVRQIENRAFEKVQAAIAEEKKLLLPAS